jgi:predicted DNA-binding transcriptional regulator AlpA
MTSTITNRRLLPMRDMCARYNVASRTIDRWADAGLLPAPVRMNGRRYWDESELEANERARARAHHERRPLPTRTKSAEADATA